MGLNVWIVNLGFFIMVIGLFFLGIIVIGVFKINGVFEIFLRISKIYGYLFIIGLYFVIGLFFVLLRFVMMLFEIVFLLFILFGMV